MRQAGRRARRAAGPGSSAEAVPLAGSGVTSRVVAPLGLTLPSLIRIVGIDGTLLKPRPGPRSCFGLVDACRGPDQIGGLCQGAGLRMTWNTASDREGQDRDRQAGRPGICGESNQHACQIAPIFSFRPFRNSHPAIPRAGWGVYPRRSRRQQRGFRPERNRGRGLGRSIDPFPASSLRPVPGADPV